MDFAQYKRILRTISPSTPDTLFERIEDVVTKTVIGCYEDLHCSFNSMRNHNFNSYELYGFDVLVDENLKPWIIEVNINPSLKAPSPVDINVKSSMLSDMFTLLGIKVHPNVNHIQSYKTSTNKAYFPAASRSRNTREDDPHLQDFPGVTSEAFESLLEVFEQNHRKGNFKRLFPSKKGEEVFNQVVKKKGRFTPTILQHYSQNPFDSPIKHLLS